MKNRRSRSEHALTEKHTAVKIKKKPVVSTTLIDRNSEFLRSYSNLFKKPTDRIGDCDTYFRKTLRNYDYLEFANLTWDRPGSVKKRYKKQFGQGDTKSKEFVPRLKHPIREQEEEELFYSPISTFESRSHTMADENEDLLVQSEHLVKETSKDLDKLEKEQKERKKNSAKNDGSILKEVEECEMQCMEIYKILTELKKRVSELLNKSSRTAEEDKELETKQKLLNEKMALLEEKTRLIESLVGKTKKQDFNKPYNEDTLPKVIVCGLAEDNMPKFIICDDKKKKLTDRKPSPVRPRSPTACPCGASSQPQTPPPMAPHLNVMPQFAQKLCESYDMQERLAQENADLEGKRYQLQEDLLNKDQTVGSLQRQLCSLQAELRLVVKENGLLNSKLQQSQTPAPPPCSPPPSRPSSPSPPPSPCVPCCLPPPPPPAAPCVKFAPCVYPPCGACPTCALPPCPPSGDEMKCVPNCPGAEDPESKKLEKQLNEMENEVRAIQHELCTVRQERLHLEQHRRMMSPPQPPPPTCPAACMPCPRPDTSQLRELREQYNTLQDDYKSKMVEVSGLRADVDKLKERAQEAIKAKAAVDDRVKELERILRESKTQEIKGGYNKENVMELEQQLSVAKQRFREAQDELEENRALVEDQQAQLTEYRNKYLEAEQTVEEQRRQIDLMELENNRIGEQVNLEIQRVKNQFQEKLQELTPLPDILKATQLKLQETQQMHLIAERNNEALLREIQQLRDKAAILAEEMGRNKHREANDDAERQSLSSKTEELEKTLQELQDENDRVRAMIDDVQQRAYDAEKRADEKLHEIAQLQAEVENVREEAARQVARTKDRCETIRRSMQNQVSDLEKQLAQSRAQAKSAQRDRDDIRCKMQSQINNLNENFEDAQMRIRTLQGHVNFLKSSAAVYPSVDCPVPAARP